MVKKRYVYVIDDGENVFYDFDAKICEIDVLNLNQVEDVLNEYDNELRMCREKSVYWRNKAEDTFGDMEKISN